MARHAIGNAFLAALRDEPRGTADNGAAIGHVAGDDRIRADLRALADDDVTQHLRARTDDRAILQRGVAFFLVRVGAAALPAQRDAVIDRDIITNDSRLADHNAGAVIDKQTRADFRFRVDFNAGENTADIRQRPRQRLQAHMPYAVVQPMQHHGMKTVIGEDHFHEGRLGQVAFLDAFD